ncbi:MAG: helix-turn-helix transcriptional regulator [Clostridia bacterium]|nr:helix-turn-helix transcriptional regulator [Clostridia bacterium]
MVNGSLIKDLRFEYGYSKSEFSKIIGIIPKTLVRIEAQSDVKEKYITKINNAIGVNLNNYSLNISKMPVGMRIKYYRMSAGFSAEDFAKQLGVDNTFIYAIESGKRNPSPPVLKRICGILNVPVKKLTCVKLNRHSTAGERLRYYRVLNGLTQKELAERIGETKAFVSKAERNLFQSTKQIKRINSIIDYLTNSK